MQKEDYRLVVTYSFKAIDDVRAKEIARDILMSKATGDKTIKLQKLEKGKPAIGIKI